MSFIEDTFGFISSLFGASPSTNVLSDSIPVPSVSTAVPAAGTSLKMVERFVQYYRKRTNQVIGIVIHYMGIEKAPIDLCIKIFNDRKVSADYMIDLDGTIYKLIPDGNYSYHAGESIMPTGESALTSTGKKTVNQITVGIELMGTINTLFTDAQYIALIGLTKTLKQKFPAINNEHIVGHQHVCIPKGRKIDPGKLFTWDRYKSSL